MQNKKNQNGVGMMIQRCHKWRQKRKQIIDQARQTSDEIERERLLQMAEHYVRMVNAEQGKIDSSREKPTITEDTVVEPVENIEPGENNPDNSEDEDMGFPDFITDLKQNEQ